MSKVSTNVSVIEVLARISSIPTHEMRWLLRRAAELRNVGFSSDEMVKTLTQEAVEKPWETP